MRGYFKPWQRKIGLVTLVFSCLLLAACVRSYQRVDYVGFPRDKDTWEEWASYNGTISRCATDMNPHYDHPTLRWRVAGLVSAYLMDSGQPAIIRLLSRDCRDYLAVRQSTFHFRNDCFQIPYWSIIFPLALLSAYLLISTPRLKDAAEK